MCADRSSLTQIEPLASTIIRRFRTRAPMRPYQSISLLIDQKQSFVVSYLAGWQFGSCRNENEPMPNREGHSERSVGTSIASSCARPETKWSFGSSPKLRRPYSLDPQDHNPAKPTTIVQRFSFQYPYLFRYGPNTATFRFAARSPMWSLPSIQSKNNE